MLRKLRRGCVVQVKMRIRVHPDNSSASISLTIDDNLIMWADPWLAPINALVSAYPNEHRGLYNDCTVLNKNMNNTVWLPTVPWKLRRACVVQFEIRICVHPGNFSVTFSLIIVDNFIILADSWLAPADTLVSGYTNEHRGLYSDCTVLNINS